MARRKSKRDTVIAEASLLVYPVAHAYDEYLQFCEQSVGSHDVSFFNIPCPEGKMQVNFRKTNDEAGVFQGAFSVSDWHTTRMPCAKFETEKRVNWSESISSEMFQSNFAKVCMALHHARAKYHILCATRNILHARGLILNVAWGRAVAKVVRTHITGNPRKDRASAQISSNGLLVETSWGVIQDDLDLVHIIRKMGKTFEATGDNQIFDNDYWLECCVDGQFALRDIDLSP